MRQHQPEAIRVCVAILTLAAFLIPSSANAQRRQSHTSVERAPLKNFHSIDQLKEAFQRDGGNVRMVVLVSPT
jgi:hypothetical protein